jgi:hypothetical protein
VHWPSGFLLVRSERRPNAKGYPLSRLSIGAAGRVVSYLKTFRTKHAASMAPEDPKFRHLFYLFKAPSALDYEISNNATYGPRCFTRAVRAPWR